MRCLRRSLTQIQWWSVGASQVRVSSTSPMRTSSRATIANSCTIISEPISMLTIVTSSGRVSSNFNPISAALAAMSFIPRVFSWLFMRASLHACSLQTNGPLVLGFAGGNT